MAGAARAVDDNGSPRPAGPGVAALVVGFGSIGRRHADVLGAMGCTVAVVSRRPVEAGTTYPSIAAAVEGHGPGYVVIANGTGDHRRALAELAAAGYRGPVLVEKPLADACFEPPPLPFASVFVGYNLRFHPGLQRLRQLLSGERVLSVQAYAGQYLPDWRPGRDYRNSYSSSRRAGGGVLRDLSHELDALSWILGRWKAVAATGGHLGSLEIDCEDTVVAVLELERCPAVSLQLNYLDRIGQRQLLVNTDRQSFALDLVGGSLRWGPGGEEAEEVGVARDVTYRRQHSAALAGPHDDLCTIGEAQEVLRLIAAIERSMTTRSWVTR